MSYLVLAPVKYRAGGLVTSGKQTEKEADQDRHNGLNWCDCRVGSRFIRTSYLTNFEVSFQTDFQIQNSEGGLVVVEDRDINKVIIITTSI